MKFQEWKELNEYKEFKKITRIVAEYNSIVLIIKLRESRLLSQCNI